MAYRKALRPILLCGSFWRGRRDTWTVPEVMFRAFAGFAGPKSPIFGLLPAVRKMFAGLFEGAAPQQAIRSDALTANLRKQLVA